MELLTPDLRAALRANADAASTRGHDPAPVVKLFNPVGSAIRPATELDADGDILFGLADLGLRCSEFGYFSLSELARIRAGFRARHRTRYRIHQRGAAVALGACRARDRLDPAGPIPSVSRG